MNTTEQGFLNYSVEHNSTLKYPFHKSKAKITVTMNFEQILLPTKKKKKKRKNQSQIKKPITMNFEFYLKTSRII